MCVTILGVPFKNLEENKTPQKSKDNREKWQQNRFLISLHAGAAEEGRSHCHGGLCS